MLGEARQCWCFIHQMGQYLDATDSYCARFIELLIAMQPASVLDVGCGDGELLTRLTGRVARLSGVDTDAMRVNTAQRASLNVIRANALQLPFDDDEFDFVVGQYTAHHMQAAMPATAEALRVARRGVMMLDVWYDRSMPAQKNSARFDEWSKRIDEDNGGKFVTAPRKPDSVLRALFW